MGRSVMTVSDATTIAYRTFEPDEEYYRERWADEIADGLLDHEEDDDKAFDTWMWKQWEWDAEYEWDSLVEWIIEDAQALWPSLEDARDDREWLHDECRVILKNAHSLVTVSEYCGSVAICLAPNYDRHDYFREPFANNLGEHWRQQISARFERELGTMTKLGTLSDGTSAYYKKVS